MMDSDGTKEFVCGVCETKTQEAAYMYYIERTESDTHGDMIVCKGCFDKLVRTGEVIPEGEEFKECYRALNDLLEQIKLIGIPDWHGAEGLDLSRAEKVIDKIKEKNEWREAPQVKIERVENGKENS